MISLKNLTLMVLALAIVALLGACSKDDESGGMGPVEEAPVEETKYYDVSFTIHRFHVNGDCDEGVLEGDGEISYGIEVQKETAPGSGQYRHVTYVDAKDYPKSSGTKYKRADSEDISVSRTVQVGRLQEGVDYRLIASAIEWDGVLGDKKDDRMSGSPKFELNTAGGKLHYEHKMILGSSTKCQLFLYFDADEVLVDSE
jgi:hypothetical protein